MSNDNDFLEASAGQDFAIEAVQAGNRLDKALSDLLPEISRSRIKALILAGHASISRERVEDPARKVKSGEIVSITIPEAEEALPQPENIPLVIVHEDADLVVIDKPAGMVVHPAAGHQTGTLVNALLFHCGESLSGIGGVKRPGIVHRLDKETSGLIVVAKNDMAHQALAAQFADHGRTGPLTREYQAFVWGAPDRRNGTIAANLDRSNINREKMAVVAADKGREAITHYELMETYGVEAGRPVASLVACQLETGRTHQIRVHMAHIGHPLLADQVYGAGFRTKAARLDAGAQTALAALGERQALHAATLGFAHPRSQEFIEFTSELPKDLALLKDALTDT